MRLLMLSSTTLPNHAAHAIQILKTAESLARLPGVGVTVYCVSLHAPAEDVLRQYGIAPRPNLELRGLVPGGLHRLFRLPPLLSPHRHFLFRLAQWRMLLDIERAARRGDAVFYTRNENMLKLFAPRARRLGMPVILELHWLKHIDRFRSFLARGGQGTARPTLSECRRELERLQRKEAAVIALADGVLCLTGPIRRRLERWGLAMPMEVLPSGVDPTLGAPDAPGPSGSPGPSAAPGPPHSPDGAGPPDGAAAKPFDVAYCGQLYPWKGVDGLVRAMAFLPGRRVALIGGADDEDRRRVERLAEELGVADRIVMTGQVGYLDVPRLLAQARACVLPAPRRGFVEARRFSSPLKLLEYAAAGKPIVASDLPNLRELLRHGDNAWLVAPDDPEALAEGIRAVLDDPALAERLGRSARALAMAHAYDARAGRIVEFIRRHAPAGVAGRQGDR